MAEAVTQSSGSTVSCQALAHSQVGHANGERVGVDGLSEGTRDQLFLALRLAALEMHIEGDRPLPFIADDLFVNFHDSRSRAGLAALGELARKTQVIFLTHHEHLVDVARVCIGREIHVVELAGA